jgi:hypothetical protein
MEVSTFDIYLGWIVSRKRELTIRVAQMNGWWEERGRSKEGRRHGKPMDLTYHQTLLSETTKHVK